MIALAEAGRVAARPMLRLDPAAVAHNVRVLRRTAGVPVLAAVKADGFGCGAEAVARAALGAGATWLGTTTLAEAVALRRAGLAARTLAWLHPVDADWETALRLRIDVAVPSADHLAALAAAARRLGVRAAAHLHVDTGMARDGASVPEWRRLVRAAAGARDAVEVVGVMGHLPCADLPGHPSTAAGIRAFAGAVAAARAAGLRPALRHLAATEAALHVPAARFDLVRVGAGLYGIGEGLREVATLTAPVVLTRRVRAGTPVGYGHTATAPRDTVLATLPVGFADGLPRSAVGAEVLLGGARRPVLGRISMDQVVVDAGPAGVPLGSVATVFGDGGPSVAEWAAWAGTNPHEVLTGVGARVVRS
ncbi:alanine racemase [Amnibacterium endophyticum]|uniref:Alanine racemase n=1 Tax=Amnibacterium endophyticum TaxID=2109337 RepID=A0ABW4LKT2_9MICO